MNIEIEERDMVKQIKE